MAAHGLCPATSGAQQRTRTGSQGPRWDVFFGNSRNCKILVQLSSPLPGPKWVLLCLVNPACGAWPHPAFWLIFPQESPSAYSFTFSASNGSNFPAGPLLPTFSAWQVLLQNMKSAHTDPVLNLHWLPSAWALVFKLLIYIPVFFFPVLGIEPRAITLRYISNLFYLVIGSH